MICPQARAEAYPRDASKSAGPPTPEGPSRSLAILQGLLASAPLPEDLPLIQGRALEIYHSLSPKDSWQAWNVDRAAVLSLRIERCERMERRIRDKVALRAELTWDGDRRLEVEALAEGLSEKPAATIEALRRTPQGCEWLLTRWAMLAHAAHANPGWTDGQASLAFDLLATPHLFREGHKPGALIDLDGNVVDPADDPAAVARKMVAELKARLEVVSGLDEAERALAVADLDLDSDAELRRLRRHEATLHGRLRWSVAQVRQEPKPSRPDPRLEPRWHSGPIETPKPAPKTEDEKAAERWSPALRHPPFDLEPDELPGPGQPPDIAAILRSRKQKRIAKAQARRDARRRKVDGLRA